MELLTGRERSSCYYRRHHSSRSYINADFGRLFEHRIHVPAPDLAARQQILKTILAKTHHAIEDSELSEVAKASEGLVGSDIKKFVRDAERKLMLDTVHTDMWTNQCSCINKVSLDTSTESGLRGPDQFIGFVASLKPGNDPRYGRKIASYAAK